MFVDIILRRDRRDLNSRSPARQAGALGRLATVPDSFFLSPSFSATWQLFAAYKRSALARPILYHGVMVRWTVSGLNRQSLGANQKFSQLALTAHGPVEIACSLFRRTGTTPLESFTHSTVLGLTAVSQDYMITPDVTSIPLAISRYA